MFIYYSIKNCYRNCEVVHTAGAHLHYLSLPDGQAGLSDEALAQAGLSDEALVQTGGQESYDG